MKKHLSIEAKLIRAFEILLIVALLSAGLPVQTAFAAGTDRYVTTTGDDASTTCASDNPCLTVARAITVSASEDTIHIAAGSYPANLTVNKDLTFIGAGMNQTLLNGESAGKVMIITGTSAVVITDLAIGNGVGENGAGIFNSGTLSLTRVKVTDNDATGHGGGIYSAGSLSMTDSVVRANAADIGGGLFLSTTNPTVTTLTRVTVSGNNVTNYGAGIHTQNSGTLILVNVTLSGNTHTSGPGGGITSSGSNLQIISSTIAYNQSNGLYGGGIHNFTGSTGSINVMNTIVAFNGSLNCHSDAGYLLSSGDDLDSADSCGFHEASDLPNTDPYLEPLADNGGYTETHALSGGNSLHPHSPAIDAGIYCPQTEDQRGVKRPQGASCDIGAYEAIVYYTATVSSNNSQDGWILESGPHTSKGGTMSSTAATFRVGDDAADKQYRNILSFSTGPKLPDTAAITKVTLRVKKYGSVVGAVTNPVTTFGGFLMYVKKGYFGKTSLEAADFQTTTGSHKYGPFKTPLVSGWYNIDLTAIKDHVNKTSSYSSLTQIRLQFNTADNGNKKANYLRLYGGSSTSRPQLVIEYYEP